MTRNTKMLVAVVAVLGAMAAYWMLILAPKREQLTKLDTDVAAAQAGLAQSEAMLKTYEKAHGGYRANYATVVRLGKAVPVDDDVRSLVVQLDSAAERSGVDFKRISVGQGGGAAGGPTQAAPTAGAGTPPPGAVSVGAAGFTAMPFSFAFDGPFDNLSTFFARLERFVSVSNQQINVTGRLLRLESLTLKPAGEDFREIRAEIGASSYLLPSTQGATGGATPTGPAQSTTVAAAQPPGAATPPTATSTGAIR